jgi:methylthioribose-1-phosphate isomerase
VGVRDVATGSSDRPSDDEIEAFRVAGRYLASRGLVRETEGNLSTFDGSRLVITRTGSVLADLGPGDVLIGTADRLPTGASSDTGLHVDHYRTYGPLDGVRAIVHAHPAGSMPAPGAEPRHGRHGVYGTGRTLEQAVAMVEMILWSQKQPNAPPLAGTIAGPFAAVEFSMGGRRLEYGREVVWKSPLITGLDQSKLPGDAGGFRCTTVDEVADAIRGLAVRGAPVLGITAAYGVTLSAFQALDQGDDVAEAVAKAAALLVETRPTAVNIRWAVQRVMSTASGSVDESEAYAEALLAETRAIEQEDADACSAIGRLGAEMVPRGANVLTHCNTGMLCTAGIGTAMGVIWCSHLAGKAIHVWVDETRPALQGARLTAWELQRLGVPMTLVADSAAGSLMARGKVDLVIVGADRIAADGDVANKIGTYSLAVLAARHGIPFYVAAHASTMDPATPSGADIRIEERDPAEVTNAVGVPIAPDGVEAANPAFDVTPSELVTAIVTDRGVVRPPYREGLAHVVEAAP